jgi:phospholipase C
MRLRLYTAFRRLPMLSLLLALAGAAQAGVIPQVRHIIIIVQENRTPDNLFHGLDRYLPGADIANSGKDSHGTMIPLKPLPLADPFDLAHDHASFVAMYNGGKMNGADLVYCSPEYGPCPPNASFHFVQPKDVGPYFSIALNYGFANRMFQTNQGPSFPAHQFLFGGTSQPAPDSPLFAADNPEPIDANAGCIAPPGAFVWMIDPAGNLDTKMYPCFEHQTLADLLDAHGVTWRYYTPMAGSIWTAPNAIAHLCQPAQSPPRCTDPHWTDGDVLLWPPQVLIDIEQRALRQVSWVIPTGQDSDHPSGNTGGGPSWVASIVNAVGQSPYWTDTVTLITWDDWGGWFDHVKPPTAPDFSYYEYGFRVPLLVVSAYTGKGYVSQREHNFGSILRFVETVFGLGLIPPDNFADARADNLSDFFDFSRTPRPFRAISQPLPAAHFLDPGRPMTQPDHD